MTDPDARPLVSLYVDGLNLYRRVLQGHPELKWLDLEQLAEQLFPEYRVLRVRYFTAIIKILPGADARSPQRQQAYIRALQTLPRTTVHLGRFRIDKRKMPAHPTTFEPDGSPTQVWVKKTEEKGSDVALASYLLLDAVKADADLYGVVSNDSDLVTPLDLVKRELGRSIALVTPMEPKRASNELRQLGPSLHRHVTEDLLALSQLPERLRDEKGEIHRPVEWTHSEGPA